MHHGVDEHRVKKRSFAFAIVYIKCFRTYSVYLSFRHGVFILYTPCHLPPQREARALPRRAQNSIPCSTPCSKLYKQKSRAHFEHGILFVIRIYLEAEAELAEELAALLSITLPGSAATTSVLGFQFAT